MSIIRSFIISLITVLVIQLGITATALENDSKTYTIDGNSLSANVTAINIPENNDTDTVYYTYTGHAGETVSATVTVIYTVP